MKIIFGPLPPLLSKNIEKTANPAVLLKKVVPLQPTLGTRSPSPATLAGEGARVPRQSSEITVSL